VGPVRVTPAHRAEAVGKTTKQENKEGNMERKNVVTIGGNPLTLVGTEIKEGDKAPDFTALDGTLKEVTLGDFGGKIKLIAAVPSLDTPICDEETRKFNEVAANLPENVQFLTISTDLPFAQSRFCQTAGIERVKVLSDHRDLSFGTAYGVAIKELRLLARSIFVIDEGDVVQYVQVVPEVKTHPDYDGALEAVKKLL
jgi:thiol peroxidase